MKLYNTLTKKKEEFVPIKKGEIKMYACGPTVYDYFHIGNARTFLTFDAMRRYFEYRGYKVDFVQNFTDIDDKIINKAKEENTTSEKISKKYIEAYFQDAESLGIKKADIHPKVTENVDEIINFIEKLIDKGYAYAINGDVYFNVDKFESYGKLSKQSLQDLQSGARIEINENKKNPLDFVLWKSAKINEPSWDSPWGKGRPGWHIECSAMAKKYLGETIDIHGGGGDLIFPHHENEIAQSEACSGTTFANYWMHVGYLNIENKKMSKSLNNFFTLREIRQEFDLEVLRLFMLSSHYRNPINFSRQLLESSKSALERLYNAKESLEHHITISKDKELTDDEMEIYNKVLNLQDKFVQVMDDDFNTADGLAVIFDIVKETNTKLNSEKPKKLLEDCLKVLCELSGVLGLLQKENQNITDEIESLISERQNARKDKNFALADEIRDKLKSMGVILEDTPQGVKWKKL
ncbi:cysteine--tRNA ligase [Serpentinicella sp. ANB-PHB4]|uniref:cysteine--tRNA ligase n=1 Tax=Serpentinicella sp. ANB-PHB4 TaxID=3074076 RepID=UPI00285BA67D|nr:cysteine--tRNA ligase [Serpentinicella sp. ANB-PHB4]MDR5659921.1 cysteine--tRNA ligase [Serpentinicella sp. ANB-PHB4]